MKRCPQCQSVYEDAKNFCLNDGTPLVADAPEARPAQPPPPAPQTSPFQPAPPTQSVGGGGWSQAGSWQSQQQPAPALAPPRKRRVWPWVVGVLGVVAVGVVALLGVIGYIGYKAVKEAERQATAARNTAGTAPRRADLQTYVNSPASFTGTLKDHYSDFSFQYPANWVLKEQPGQSRSNFVKVERSLDGSTTLENFAVGWYTSTGTAEGDAALFPQLTRQLSAQFAAGFPGYRKVSEGAARVGSYAGYEFRFTGRLRNPQGKNVDLYGRAVMLPSGSAEQRNGVALIMLATSLAPEIRSADDVGVKGELPVILESFRMGKGDAAASDAAPGGTASEAASGDDPSGEIANAEQAAATAVRGVFGGEGADAPTDRAEVLEQLKRIEEEWARANNEGDKEAAGRILAEEYVGTDHTGATERKAEYVRNLRPNAQVESQSFEDLKVVVAGGRAILTGVTEVDFKGGRTGRFRFVDTFVWRDGRWQAVASTSSEIQ